MDFLSLTFGAAPEVAVVLGSGLSSYADRLQNSKRIPASEIPGSIGSTVQGHSGSVVLGTLGTARALVLAGRIHGYEGHSPEQVVHNVRALRLWGIQKFVITNAAGSTSLKYKPGSLVLLKDHINFTGQSPLTGKELFGGSRFPDMSDAYSKKWRARVLALAKKEKLKLPEGIYAGCIGPSYETPAEIRMLKTLGADLVGMSTVWEALALHQMGTEILGLSCVTNFGTGVTTKKLSHEEVIKTTQHAQKLFFKLMDLILQKSLG